LDEGFQVVILCYEGILVALVVLGLNAGMMRSFVDVIL